LDGAANGHEDRVEDLLLRMPAAGNFAGRLFVGSLLLNLAQ
jgi:hypothetical protein